jgi:hypothetical protein
VGIRILVNGPLTTIFVSGKAAQQATEQARQQAPLFVTDYGADGNHLVALTKKA